MLVFISDLHFVDETVGKHNPPAAAMELFMKDLADHASDNSEITIVFLGDVFDLNRTDYWFGVPEAERPWGDIAVNRKKTGEHAEKIMNGILKANKDTFNILSGKLKDRYGLPSEPKRVYIPGNHDRMCNMYDGLRKLAVKSLGIDDHDPSERFGRVYRDDRYGVCAMHGHEFDEMNYEGSELKKEEDYDQVPIGDLLTTEIASRLPVAIMAEIGDSMPKKDKEKLRRNLEDIENVRPYSAMFRWLFYQVKENPKLVGKMDRAVEKIIQEFNGLSYLHRWYKRHDKFFRLDTADKIQAAIKAFEMLEIKGTEKAMAMLNKVSGKIGLLEMGDTDQTLLDKGADFLSHTSDYRYFVMGHSHQPRVSPIRVTSQGLEQVYFNSGTWRTRHIECVKDGFVGVKHFTYVVFYDEKENPNQRFETWTGTLKETAPGKS